MTPELIVAVSAVPVKSGVSDPTGARNASAHALAVASPIMPLVPYAWCMRRLTICACASSLASRLPLPQIGVVVPPTFDQLQCFHECFLPGIGSDTVG